MRVAAPACPLRSNHVHRARPSCSHQGHRSQRAEDRRYRNNRPYLPRAGRLRGRVPGPGQTERSCGDLAAFPDTTRRSRRSSQGRRSSGGWTLPVIWSLRLPTAEETQQTPSVESVESPATERAPFPVSRSPDNSATPARISRRQPIPATTSRTSSRLPVPHESHARPTCRATSTRLAPLSLAPVRSRSIRPQLPRDRGGRERPGVSELRRRLALRMARPRPRQGRSLPARSRLQPAWRNRHVRDPRVPDTATGEGAQRRGLTSFHRTRRLVTWK